MSRLLLISLSLLLLAPGLVAVLTTARAFHALERRRAAAESAMASEPLREILQRHDVIKARKEELKLEIDVIAELKRVQHSPAPAFTELGRVVPPTFVTEHVTFVERTVHVTGRPLTARSFGDLLVALQESGQFELAAATRPPSEGLVTIRATVTAWSPAAVDPEARLGLMRSDPRCQEVTWW